MFYKVLLYVVISLFCLKDETSAERTRITDPKLTIINVYSGLESIDGEKLEKPEEKEDKQNSFQDDDKNNVSENEDQNLPTEDEDDKRSKTDDIVPSWKNALLCDWKKFNPNKKEKIDLDPNYLVNCESKLKKHKKDTRGKSLSEKPTKKHTNPKIFKTKLPFMFRGYNSWKLSNPYRMQEEDDVEDTDPAVIVDGEHLHQHPQTNRYFTRLRYIYQPVKRALNPGIRLRNKPRYMRYQRRRQYAYQE